MLLDSPRPDVAQGLSWQSRHCHFILGRAVEATQLGRRLGGTMGRCLANLHPSDAGLGMFTSTA